MNSQLATHAHSINEQIETLLNNNDDPVNERQLAFLEKIQTNTTSFIDAYERLSQMPMIEIASALNHDVRNLITPISGYIELLEMQVVGTLSVGQNEVVQTMMFHVNELRIGLDALISNMRGQLKPVIAKQSA